MLVRNFYAEGSLLMRNDTQESPPASEGAVDEMSKTELLIRDHLNAERFGCR